MKQQGMTGCYHQNYSLNYFYLHALYLQHFSKSEKIKQTPHVQCSLDSQMTQYCFGLKVRLLLSIKRQIFISACSAEGCGEKFISSFSGADLELPLQSLTVRLVLQGYCLQSSSQTLPWNGRSTSPLQVPLPHLFLLWSSISVKQVQSLSLVLT